MRKPIKAIFVIFLAFAGIGLAVWWSLRPSQGSAVFNVGDAEADVIDRIPEASLTEHEVSIVNGGMEYRFYKCVYAKSGDSHPVMLMFANGRLKNVFPWSNWERMKDWMERENVPYEMYEYGWGPPLDYARMLLELGGSRESDKWKVGFYAQGELDSVDWGLAIVALPFAVFDRLVSPRRPSSQTAIPVIVDRSERLSRSIRLGMSRQKVESTMGAVFSVDGNGLSYYVSKWDEKGAQVGVIVRYDTNAKVDAVFNLDLGSRRILKREMWSKMWKHAGHAELWYNMEAMNKTTGTFDGTVIRSVCHGSQVVVRVPRILRTRYTKDFGPGFYCTVMRDQAVRWAVRFTGQGWLSHFTYTPDPALNQLVFARMTEEWLDFIVACRHGEGHAYDIVEGPMANDTIYNYVQDFIDGKITRAAFWELARFKHPTHQICFCTELALAALRFDAAEEVYDE